MAVNVAINGFGRIGRAILRANYERNPSAPPLKIKAINDLGDPRFHCHLTKFDSVHGKFFADLNIENNKMYVNSDVIEMFSERDPSLLPWHRMDIDVVLECTGLFTKREKASLHIRAGAKRVLISAPSSDADATIVYAQSPSWMDNHFIFIKLPDHVNNREIFSRNC